MSDKEISGASDKVVILGLHRSSLTSGRADAANIPAPSILAELEKNNRILAAERDALLVEVERLKGVNYDLAGQLMVLRATKQMTAAIDAAKGET